ncbi:MAG: hypothetical protein ACFNZJ_04205 [Parascardovia denticolens]
MNQDQKFIYVGLFNHFRDGVLFDFMNNDGVPLSSAEEEAAEDVEEAIIGLLDVLDPEAQWDGVELEEGQIGNFGGCVLSDDVAREGESGEAVDSE